ncbi:MAG: hypothetical protein JWM80_1519 [Cyanobacteria bacterium RYN_339]|nr:hypothetical protein [Cyanobacteria bacterium RYN_339]
MSANWFQSPLAVDAALREPLRRALGSSVPLLSAVRSLLIRRCLTPEEGAMLERARLTVLDVSTAFVKLEADLRASAPKARTGMLTLPSAPAQPLVPAPVTAPTAAPDVAPTTVRIMIKAMSHAVRAAGSLEGLMDPEPLAQALGAGIARVLSEDLFPPLGDPDANAPLREVVAGVLGARRVTEATLDAIGPMDRQLVAQRLDSRMALMMCVVPPARALTLGRVIRGACMLLRQAPPVDADTLNQALVSR